MNYSTNDLVIFYIGNSYYLGTVIEVSPRNKFCMAVLYADPICLNFTLLQESEIVCKGSILARLLYL